MPRFTAMLFTGQLFLYWRWSSQHCFLHYVFILNQFSRQIGSKFPRLFFVFVLKPYHVIFRLKWRTTRLSKKYQVGQKGIKKKFQKVIHPEIKILYLEILLHIYKSFLFWVIWNYAITSCEVFWMSDMLNTGQAHEHVLYLYP